MFSIAAINETESKGKWEPLAPTKEAQEFHLSQTYHDGLLKIQAKDYEKARELLETVLKDPLISNAQIYNAASDHHLLQLRFLSLKNLANVFLQQGSLHYESALQCYLQAVELDQNDSVVWNHLGTLSCKMGLLSTSRWAFEQGLVCSPNNWNCMEKLLEVLIAIGDEVACLCIANLILRHWPSHSRALHVKKTIEDAEPIPFAPRGIDKLEPKHIRLRFPDKRKLTDNETDSNATAKRPKQTLELQLTGVTWLALLDAILNIFLSTRKVLEPGVLDDHDNVVNEKLGHRHRKEILYSTITDKENQGDQSVAYVRIDIKLPESSEIIMDSEEVNENGLYHGSEGTSRESHVLEKSTIVKGKYLGTDREHHQERRSTRLERLRSRKLGKEDLEASGKDQAKLVVQPLEPFVLKKPTEDSGSSSSYAGAFHDSLPYTSVLEHNGVVEFTSKASKVYGAFRLAHLFLEEVAHKCIYLQAGSEKILELEKLTRNWGQDRSMACSLFLAELYYDQGSCSEDKSKQLQYFSEANYHLCKVVELVTLESPDDLLCKHLRGSRSIKEVDNIEDTIILSNGRDKQNTLPSNGSQTKLYNSTCQEKNVSTSTSTNDTALWVRFFWLCGRLSLSEDCKSKAFNEFSICLSLLRSNKNSEETSDFVFLPHCELVKLINVDRVLHEINMLKLDSLLEKAAEMMGKGMYSECIDMLAPLLLSSRDTCIDLVLDVLKGSERLTSTELSAIDLVISACENLETMDTQVYLNCHRRRLQVLTASARMVGSSHRSKSSMPKASDCFDLDVTESINKKWRQMVAEEVKDVSRVATRVKSFLDQSNVYAGLDSLIPIISDIQSLLLTVMCSTVRTIIGQKFSSSTISNQTDQMETWCLIDAAIAFCKLQHLHPSVSIKAHVDLIVAVHDLLAEFGLCCAGRDGEREEGTFLKFAIKHLLALDVKLKSLSGTNGEEEVASMQKMEGEDSTTLEVKGNDKEASEPGKMPMDIKLDSSTEDCRNITTGDLSNAVNLLTDEEIEEVELNIDNALDQSFFCLYGLKINPDSSSEEELAVHKNTSRGDYQTKEQCADVFHYILPYAKALSRAGLVKLRRVLRAIRKHFPQPPDDILANNMIDKFLDGPKEWEDKLCQVAGTSDSQELIMSILFANGRGPDAMTKSTVLSSEQYFEVYGNLYYYIAQAEEVSATDKYPGFVLKKEGEEFVEQNANLFKYDLLYNPLRFESWQKLANIYDEEVDLLLNDGSKHINILDWRKNTTLIQRVEAGRRRSRRCFLMSLALASSHTQQCQIHELLALVYYDSIQNVAPFYDQRSVLPVKDAVWMSFCQSALGHFEKAFALKPEWLHAFYLGKLCEKIGFSPEKALSYYSKAASLNPSGVDPVYRMHASRMKLLYKRAKENLDILQIVAAYAFSQSTKESIQTMFNWTNENLQESTLDTKNVNDQNALKEKRNIDPNLLDKAWHILYDDCLLGLGICVEGELKHFHKARYALAQGLYKRGEAGDLEKARDELSFCFKSSRSSFTINMWEIDGATRKGRRKNPGVAGNKKCLEVSLSESSRKFITCIRKYVLLYLNLLEKSGDLCTLEKGYSYLRTDKRFSLCLGDIVPVALGKYIQVLISTIHSMETQNATDKSISLEQMLEKLFSIFMDHINLWADISSLPELNKPELLESNLYCYIHQYIHLLESDIRLDALEGINEKIRKRFKNPKLSNSNFAKICKHASLAWCRSITIKLALITPLPILELNDRPQTDAVENGLLLYVDLQPDKILISPLEDPAQSKGLDMNWFETLSKIKNIRIRQASEENMEAAVALLRCTYNFYRESSCGTFPSGINLYTVFLSQTTLEGTSQQEKEVVDVLDLSIPRKLLLWAYTLVHGRYSNISAVVKYCEEAKSRMKRGVMMTQTSVLQTNVPPAGAHTAAVPGREKAERSDHVEIEDHSVISVASATHPVDVVYIPSSSCETQKTSSQLQRCNSSKGQEPCKANTIADLNSTDN